MGRRKKAAAKFEAWCWYCDRDFEDEKVLLQHQRAKHYRCPYCPRRLNTSGGLTVHLHQVHKAEPTTIENALPGRESFDIEIYGMVGIPHDDLVEWQARKEKRGQGGGDAAYGGANGASKRPKIDKGVIPIEQLRMQLEAHKALMSGKAPPPGFGFGVPIGFPPPSFNVPPPGYAGPPPGMSPFQRPPPPFGIPPPPMAGGVMPPFSGPPPGYPNVPPPSLLPAASAQSKATSLPTYNPHEQAVKQGAKTRIVYADTNVSPEEKLASTSKYRYVDPTEVQQPPPAAMPYPPPNYSVPPPGFAPPAAAHVPSPQPQAQSYPAAMHTGGVPASANPLANTAEALAAVNASVGVAEQQQQREADMKHMQGKADVAMAGEEATPEPVGMTEAAVANDAFTESAPATRSGRKRASDLF